MSVSGIFPDNPCTPALKHWLHQHGADLGVSFPMQVGVAFSGGADSTALLLAAQALCPGRVVALHVNHGLQSAAAEFEQSVRQRCLEWQIPLEVVHVDARHLTGQSPEEAARIARYRALAQAAQRLHVKVVLLGQHAQDQVETLLLALSRGAGLAGLAGMPERFEREGMWFGRPMLGVDGDQLRTHLQHHAVPYVNDPTNSDERYTRNRIRARLMPALAEAFPGYLSTFARSARHAAQAVDLLEEVAEMDLRLVGLPPSILSLQSISRARQANVLRWWLRTSFGAVPSEAQLSEALDQIAACTTRGHRIELRVAQGTLQRQADTLAYSPWV